MTFKQIEEKFIPVWEKMKDFVPMNSKLESERLKRPRIQLDKERFKKLKTAKASGTESTQEQQSKELTELSEEELKKMMELVPVEELYIEALQRDSKIAMIHAKKVLEMMIVELDRSNEMVAKYLSEYEQAEAGLSHNEKVELINELLRYQRHLA
nr:hypothetical protein [Tanacetum cinerariifolium]